MTDWTQFYANFKEDEDSKFKETVSLEVVKASQGGEDLTVEECEPKFDAQGNQTNKGRCYFACGMIRGAVSQKLADKMNAGEKYDTLVVSHVIDPDSDFNGLVLHEKGKRTQRKVIATF